MGAQMKVEVKPYSAADISWAHEVASSDLDWALGGIADLEQDIKEVQQTLKNQYGVSECSIDVHFNKFKRHLQMLEYLLDERLHYHKEEASKYGEENNLSKNAGRAIKL